MLIGVLPLLAVALFAAPSPPLPPAPPTYTVAFELNDQTGALHGPPAAVTLGASVAMPAPPTREGYQFHHWSTDVLGSVPYNFDWPVTADRTLWAQWRATYTDAFLVLIFTEDGELMELKNVPDGEPIAEPDPPDRDGYRFVHWSGNRSGQYPFDFKQPITGNVELYAHWRLFPPPTDALDEVLERHGTRVSVYFENLETGFVYRHNAEQVYTGASVIKAPFSLYIYQKAELGETDLDSGSRSRTQRELLRRNLMYSCNDSTTALRNIHGVAGYRQFVEDLGGHPNWVVPQVFGGRMTVDEAGLFARAIYAYLESDGRYSEEFKAHLLDNQFPFITGLDYPVASKTGWVPPRAWHDMAIVYAPSPFILVIFSARSGWSNTDYQDFAEIAMAFQMFNDTWFVDET